MDTQHGKCVIHHQPCRLRAIPLPTTVFFTNDNIISGWTIFEINVVQWLGYSIMSKS